MKNLRKLIVLIIFSASILLLSACNDDVEVPGDFIEVEHDLGVSKVPKDINKFVVLDYGVLDNIDVLGLDDKLSGLSKKSLPEYLMKYSSEDYEDLGSLKEVNFEKLYELKPDLIIIGDRQAEQYDEFNEIAPTIYLSGRGDGYTSTIEKNLGILAEIFDKKEETKKLVDNFKIRVDNLAKENSKVDGKVLFLMANDGELKAHGRGSRFGMVFDDFNLKPVDENLEVSTHGQKINFEYILNKNPEYILVMDRSEIAGGNTRAKETLNNKIIKESKAYKLDNISYLNSPVWYLSAGGIQASELMIDDIERAIK